MNGTGGPMSDEGKLRLFAAFGATLTLSQPAAAASTHFEARGTVTSITALQNGTVVSTPPGLVKVGDNYSLTATFDPSKAILGYAINPSVNVYDLPGTNVGLALGSYSDSFVPLFDFDSTLQLWNNYNFGLGATDSQSFFLFNYNVQPSGVPFSVGSGMLSEGVSFDAFDFGALARSNNLISSISPFSSFGSQSFSYDLLNSATGLSVVVQGNVTTSFITPTTVPEPTDWTFLLLGFAASGLSLRFVRNRDARSTVQRDVRP